MKIFTKSPEHHCQAGFGMIEVLIALLVLSFGLLGLAGLQMSGLKGSHTASLRSTASLAAYEMAERMRLNAAGLALGAYDAADTDSAPADPGCIDAGCSAQDMANTDIREMSLYFNNLDAVAGFVPTLPDGRLQVALNAGIYAITVSWTEMSEDGVAGTQQFLVEFQP